MADRFHHAAEPFYRAAESFCRTGKPSDGQGKPSSGQGKAPGGAIFLQKNAGTAVFRALVKQIKASTSYSEAIGEALGIEGAQQTGPDLTTIQPDFDATVSGNQVSVNWGWGGNSAYLDMIRLEADRGDGNGFQFLANDTTPGYTDTTPLPATPTKWSYRGIYIVGDAQVGVWSKTGSVTVGG
jgi:hypothetical protein